MKKVTTLVIAILLIACTPMKPVLSVSETKAFPVKGRNGLLIKQKLSFGDYQSSAVKRSWTRSGNTRINLISGRVADPTYPNLISKDYSGSEQNFYFSIADFFGNAADVYAVSEFHSEDLRIGDNPNSVINILEDIFGGSDFSEDLFYLQIFLNDEVKPWQLVLDNQAAQFFAEEYTGFLALSEKEFYALQPLTQVEGKNGAKSIGISSLGYEIFNSKGISVAAVSLLDNGEVYLHTKDPSERLLLSALCAALLLQNDIAMDDI